jgi:SAM-dependent methyltransferase
VKLGGPVLEPGCGTGRTLFPIAAEGIDITGVEPAAEMLAIARGHAARLSAEVVSHVSLQPGDMRDLAGLDGPYRLISLPYRTFQHLLTPQDQRLALEGFRRLLEPGGRLVLNQFDPTLDIAELVGSPPPAVDDVGQLPVDTQFTEAGQTIRVRYRRGYDLAAQVLQQEFFYETLGEDGQVSATERGQLTLRYTYRYEMEWLLATCGFRVVSLAGDFDGGPYPGYGEQVWVAAPA